MPDWLLVLGVTVVVQAAVAGVAFLGLSVAATVAIIFGPLALYVLASILFDFES